MQVGLRVGRGVGIWLFDELGVLVARFVPVVESSALLLDAIMGVTTIQLVIGTNEQSFKLIPLRLNGAVESGSELLFIVLLLFIELGLPVGPSMHLAML